MFANHISVVTVYSETYTVYWLYNKDNGCSPGIEATIPKMKIRAMLNILMNDSITQNVNLTSQVGLSNKLQLVLTHVVCD